MVSVPAVCPVTIPLITEAVVLLLPHIPPATLSVSVMEEPAHTLDGPFMLPGVESIVTVLVAIHPPVKV